MLSRKGAEEATFLSSARLTSAVQLLLELASTMKEESPICMLII
jgi:hypothetical protein